MIDSKNMYCPSCGKASFQILEEKKGLCSACQFTYFHNVATAVATIICVNEEVLLLQRALDPNKGKLGLPGGFVDPYESAEEAAYREVQEEVGLSLQEPLQYHGSWSNQYYYKEINYHTQDIYYITYLSEKPTLHLQQEEVADAKWVHKEDIVVDSLAFASTRVALAKLSKGSI